MILRDVGNGKYTAVYSNWLSCKICLIKRLIYWIIKVNSLGEKYMKPFLDYSR